MLTAMKADMCSKCLVTDPWVRSFMRCFRNPVAAAAFAATETKKLFLTRQSGSDLHFLRDDFEHERSQHERSLLFFGCNQIGPDFVCKRRVDSAEFLQSQKMDLNESGRPLPHVIARLQAKNSRRYRAHRESVLR